MPLFCRSSELRLKAMQKMMKTLSLLEGNEEVALNDVSSKRPQTVSVRSENKCSPHLLQGKHCIITTHIYFALSV